MNKIFFTDGACSGNPGPGGFGVISLNKVHRQTLEEYIPSYSVEYMYSEQCDNTTNNREEMKAILHVFALADKDRENNYIIYSDSAYCVNMINDWIFNWSKNNWKNSKKQTVENLDLIQSLYKYLNTEFFNCQVLKVRGHDGQLENECADALATNNSNKLAKLFSANHILT